MPRKPSPEREAEYERLVQLFSTLAPIAFANFEYIPDGPALARAREQHGFSSAFSGLKQAANDLLEALSYGTPTQLEAADTALKAAGLGSLGALLATKRRFISELLRRGALITDTEYYALREVTLGSSSPLGADDLVRAEAMLHVFEQRAVS